MSYSVPSIEQTTAISEKYFAALKAWDTESFKSLVSPDLRFRVLPKSINGPSLSGADQVLGVIKMAQSLLIEPKLSVVDMNVSPGKIWAHATMQATLTNDKPYDSEYIFMLEVGIVESGEAKVTALTEFADAISSQPFTALMHETMAKHAAQS